MGESQDTLDLDDVAAGHPMAEKELAEMRESIAERDREHEEDVEECDALSKKIEELERERDELAAVVSTVIASSATPDAIALAREALARRDARVAAEALPSVDKLAQIIREVDGKHSLGAGALSERIIDRLRREAEGGE